MPMTVKPLLQVHELISNKNIHHSICGEIKDVFEKLDAYWFDKQHNIETTNQEYQYLRNINDKAAADAQGYQAITWRSFKATIEQLNIRYPDYTFLDLGSGKGRGLLFAAQFHFKRVIGVEISPYLCDISESNIERFHHKAPLEVKPEIVCENAANYSLPNDNLVIFINNAFIGETMKKTLKTIDEKAKSNNVFLIYSNPVCGEMFEQLHNLYPVTTNAKHFIYRSLQ